MRSHQQLLVKKSYKQRSEVTAAEPRLDVRVTFRGENTYSEVARVTPTRKQEPVPAQSAGRIWASRAFEAVEHSLVRFPVSLPIDPRCAREEFVSLYERRFEQGTALAWLKFHGAFAFGAALCQSELPISPDGLRVPTLESLQLRCETHTKDSAEREDDGTFCKGLKPIFKMVMARGAAGSWPFRRVAYDVLMSKVGMPPAPASFIGASYEKHRNSLCRDPPAPLPEEFVEQVGQKLEQICSALFQGQQLEVLDLMPSFSACEGSPDGLYNADGGRKVSGAFGSIVAALCEDVSSKEEQTLIGGESALKGPGEGPSFVGSYGCGLGSLLYAACTECEEFLGFTHSELNPHPVYMVFHRVILDALDDQLSFRMKEFRENLQPLKASPVAILEPLKVRMITKGPPLEYYRAMSIQRCLHRALRRSKTFQFIGKPIDDESWAALMPCLDEIADDEFYVSGDYEGATDNLNPELSELAWDTCCRHIRWRGSPLTNTIWHWLGRYALVGHQIERIEVGADGKRISTSEYLRQTWGQLMGSPVSFPILCLVNLALTLVGLERDFTDEGIAVNGDDIAFVTDEAGYKRWGEVTARGGLKKSVGKNYTSRQFVIMNSELRRVPDNRRTREEAVVRGWEMGDNGVLFQQMECIERLEPWKFEGYYNQSLVRGIQRKGLDAGESDWRVWSELSDVAHAAIRGIEGKYVPAFMRIFLESHKESLREAPAMANKYLPTSAGGMGLPWVEGMEISSDKGMLQSQLKQAGFLMCSSRRQPSFVPQEDRGPVQDALGRQRERYSGQDALQKRFVSFWKPNRPEGGPLDVAQLLLDGLHYANRIGWFSGKPEGWPSEAPYVPAPFEFCTAGKRSRDWFLGESQRVRSKYLKWTRGWTRYSLSVPSLPKLLEGGWERPFIWTGSGFAAVRGESRDCSEELSPIGWWGPIRRALYVVEHGCEPEGLAPLPLYSLFIG